jgi:hypothetical protein
MDLERLFFKSILLRARACGVYMSGSRVIGMVDSRFMMDRFHRRH